jgi:hypothetical protein
VRRNDEHLIRKRSGAREWFRLTKLARSLALALEGADAVAIAGACEGVAPAGAASPDPFELALELARSIHVALRRRHDLSPAAQSGERDVTASSTWLTAEDVAAAAERALWVCGRTDAAVRYVEARRASLRAPRRVVRARSMPIPSLAAATDVGGSTLSPVLPVRLPFDQNGLG